ncbi:MAG TPA: glycosyl hydrolase [Saprospiraceae bacterium]|nr:glycosyl hydrolase [Saprospiraceae bacterium]
MKPSTSALFICLIALSVLIRCTKPSRGAPDISTPQFYPSSKPFSRWWWFATEIRKPDIKYQLDWAKEMNLGGVEIAWVYPLYRYQAMYAKNYNRHYPKDTSAQKWLSPEWSEIVAYTKSYADSIGLACDFTFGSAWPIAGSHVGKEYRTQIYGDTTFQQLLTFTWEYPDTQFVINHLDSNAFYLFAEPVGDALKDALKGSKSALFTDSWEIKLNATNKIWTRGFEHTFRETFGYDIIPYMDTGLDSFPDVRYDYMLHLDEYVTNGFYKPFVKKCRELGAWSRVQCLASPTDVMTTYAFVDIPETEAMLNNPNYSRIVSSSACLASKRLVSSETFTCMYGFPATYLRQEQTGDLKMVADALFAQGVNHHVYHGMPYNPQGSDTMDFFATTYVGPGGSLSPELPAFNAYIEKVSGILQRGKTYTDVAVYIPYEDGVMKGAYPPERQRVWVWGEYELRYVYPPKEAEGYHPLWINRHFLEQAEITHPGPLLRRERTHPNPLLRREGIGKRVKLKVGDAEFSVLYIDVEYMDVRALRRVLALARQGLPVCLKRFPKEPGKMKSGEYADMLNALASLQNVSEDFKQVIDHPPLIQGDSLPEYWCKVEDDGTHYLFLAQWPSKDLTYPIYSGQSYMKQSNFSELTLNINGNIIRQKFEFKPYQSLMLRIPENKEVKFIDITFIPKDPVIRPREEQRMYF